MAGKPKNMSQIKQLLQLRKQGQNIKPIARILGISKTTVKSYLARIEATGMSTEQLLVLDNPVLEAKLLAGNPSYKPDERYEQLSPFIIDNIKELNKVGVTRKVLWEEYRQLCSAGYSYTQFCYHLSQYKKAAHPSMVLEHLPGDKLYIDFAGKKLSYVDVQTGEMIECQVFVACLPYSDYGFAIAVRSQSLGDFIYALSRCMEAMGGVPAALVPDNLKAAVTKANNYEPDINQALSDFANHYGTTVIPARALKPQDKALVENQVKLIYNRVYAKIRKQTFFDLQSLNDSIFMHTKAHNQTRMQRKDYCREEKFLSDEKQKLKELPSERFEIKYYKRLKVAQNNHIYLSVDRHYYSVPYTNIGKDCQIIFTHNIVKIYHGGKLLASHIRNYQANGYSTIKEHLCSHHQHYMSRSPEYYKNRAKTKSSVFYELIEKIFQQNKHPEQLYRTCDGLFDLHRKTESETFILACETALKYENYSYRFIKNIITNNMSKDNQTYSGQISKLPDHQNKRGPSYYK